MELEFADDPTGRHRYLLHVHCFGAWDAERRVETAPKGLNGARPTHSGPTITDPGMISASALSKPLQEQPLRSKIARDGRAAQHRSAAVDPER